MRFLIRALGLLSFCFVTGLAGAQTARTLTFGVVPQQAASELAETWSPVLAWLSRHTSINLRFSTAPDIPSFEQRLAKEEYDLAYMNPYHFVVFNEAPGYQALARAKDLRLQGLIVVRKNSTVKNLKDLNGQTLVFPAPAAFAASILPRAELRRQGINFTPRFVSSHDSVYLAVEKDLFAAGGGINRTWELLESDVAQNLRILWKTPNYTAHAIANHPRVTSEQRATLLKAMAAMTEDPEGLKLLKTIGFKGFEPAANADWNDVRALKIQPSDAQIQN